MEPSGRAGGPAPCPAHSVRARHGAPIRAGRLRPGPPGRAAPARLSRKGRGGGPSAALREPLAPAAEDDDVAAVRQGELEVATAQRPRRPPAILDQPLLANRLDRHVAEADRRAVPARA